MDESSHGKYALCVELGYHSRVVGTESLVWSNLGSLADEIVTDWLQRTQSWIPGRDEARWWLVSSPPVSVKIEKYVENGAKLTLGV